MFDKRSTEDTWILIADRGRARIVSRSHATGKLEIEQSLECPQGSSHVSELVTDQQGRFRVSGGPTSNGETQSNLKRHTAARFARTIVARLEKGKQLKKFGELELVVAPSFLGAVRSALSPGLEQLVTRSIARDFTSFSIHELSKRLITAPSPANIEAPVLSAEAADEVLVVEVTGDLGAISFERVQSDAEEIVRGLETSYAVRHVVIDLERCDYFGSAGIGFFMRLWTQVRSRGGSMAVCNASELERELLALTRLDELWPIRASMSDAVAAVRSDVCYQG